MKLIILTLMAHFLIITSSFCGELVIESPKTVHNIAYKIKYKADKRFENFDTLTLICYQFNSAQNLPNAKDIILNYDDKNNIWYGEFLPDSITIYTIFKIVGKNHSLATDNNFGDYWELFIKKNGKIQIGANLIASISYLGIMPENFRRNVDFHLALSYLESELNLDSFNIQAGIGLNSLMFDLKKITESQFINNITKVLDRFDEKQLSYMAEDEIKSVIRGYNIINKRDYSDKIEKKYAELNPKSEFAETSLLNKIKSSASLNEFLKYCSDFLRLFPNSHNKDKIYYAIIESHMQSGKYKELLKQLDSLNINEPSIFLELATNIINNKVLSKKLTSEEIISVTDEIIKNHVEPIFQNNDFENDINNKPQFYSVTEWYYKRLELKSKISEACGDFYSSLNHLIKAKNYYELANKISGNSASSDMYYKLISINIKSNDLQNAYNLCTEAISNSEESPEIINKHEEMYKLLNYDTSKWDKYQIIFDSLSKAAERNRLEKLSYKEIQNKIISGTYRTLDGRVFDFNDLKGKLAVILFWSSWCEPCKAVYPAYKELFNKYKESDSIILISINVWEKSDKRLEIIEQFLKSNELGFPVFVDDYGLIPYIAGITGLPAMIFKDKNSNIRFIELGFDNEYQLLRDAEDRINFILNKKE